MFLLDAWHLELLAPDLPDDIAERLRADLAEAVQQFADDLAARLGSSYGQIEVRASQ